MASIRVKRKVSSASGSETLRFGELAVANDDLYFGGKGSNTSESGTTPVPATRVAKASELPTSASMLMAGYEKPNTTSAISTSDSVNVAIGKLEKALDGVGDGTITDVQCEGTSVVTNGVANVTKTALNLATVYTFKGTKETYADLPTTGNTVGDVWDVTSAYGDYPANTNYAWTLNGSVGVWESLGGFEAYDLPTASASTKGGIKIGNGLEIANEVASIKVETSKGLSVGANGIAVVLTTNGGLSVTANGLEVGDIDLGTWS